MKTTYLYSGNQLRRLSSMKEQDKIIGELALKAIKMSANRPNEVERSCWVVVHEYLHGVMPVEYDIREIDEALYLNILKCVKKNIS